MYRKHLKRSTVSTIIFFFVIAGQVFAQSPGDSSYIKKFIRDFCETQASVKYIYQCTINSTGDAIAWSADTYKGQRISIRYLSQTNNRDLNISAADSGQNCTETEPQFSPDGKNIAFLSDALSAGQLQVFIADAKTGILISNRPFTNFNGYISHLHWSPDGAFLSVLYVEKADRNPNPMAALNRNAGLIDSAVNNNIQRIAIVNIESKKTRLITPQQLYVFEYDWSQDSKIFCYTAAPAPGDDNWYVAKLYTQSIQSNEPALQYQPALQIAVPRWSKHSIH
jgi:Tol biopolymer transport system component